MRSGLPRCANSTSDLEERGHRSIRCGRVPQSNVPHNLLILSLTRLNLQTLVIHLMYIPSSLHVIQDVVLQLRHRLQRVPHILILLNISNDLSSLGTFSEVDEVSLLNNGRNAVLDKSQVGQVDTFTSCEYYNLPPAFQKGGLRTEERNTRGVGCMEGLSVLAEVLGACHDPPHRFQRRMCALGYLVPCSLETSDRRGAQCGNDGS